MNRRDRRRAERQVNELNRKGLGLPGSCTVCLCGTDTAMAFRGEPEWCVAGLVVLGLSEDQAIAMFEAAQLPMIDGAYTLAIRVCRDCVSKTGFPEPRLAVNGSSLPCIQRVPQ